MPQETSGLPDQPSPSPTLTEEAGEQSIPANTAEIIVVGNRAHVGALTDVPVEQTYEQDDIAVFGASTVAEILEQLQRENGDEAPTLLVNGRPVRDAGDIADIPVEAIERVETLPRGSATRVGGSAGERAYNVVLRRSVKTLTGTASREVATEGGWSNNRGEAIFTLIKDQDRLNFTARAGQSDILLESERDFAGRTQTTPFAPLGNIIPSGRTEIDPALSEIVGRTISVAAVPAGNTTPSLSDFAAQADIINASGLAAARSLRSASRPLEIALLGNKQFNNWLSLAVNSRATWTQNESLTGLPTARFLIPESNPFSPFSRQVAIALNDPERPLRSRTDGNSQSVSATLNAVIGTWRAALNGQWDRRFLSNEFEFSGPLGAELANVDPATNPFAGTLAALIPVDQRKTESEFITSQVSAEFDGPLISLWAGPITARTRFSAQRITFDARDNRGDTGFERSELTARAGLTIPLTSKAAGVLPKLGDSNLDLDFAKADLGQFGSLERWSVALNWQMLPWLQVVLRSGRDETAVPAELISAPELITPNVPYFDPLRGETVEVTTISGGAANLANESSTINSLGLTATPLRKYRFQFDLTYYQENFANQIGALPFPPGSSVVQAFPDRFVRDADGVLVRVDSRAVNFDRQNTDQLRLGVRFVIPLEAAKRPMRTQPGERRRREPQLSLQFNASHTIILESTATIREGLPEVDLLDGGGIGVGGGLVRNATRANLGVIKGGSGFRLEYARRGPSNLLLGPADDQQRLRFGALSTLDARLIGDLAQLFPASPLLRGVRVTATLKNAFNERQIVTDSEGLVPQAYNPIRRDPIGRTFMFELRKVF